jgi:hypothetical protein
MIKIKLTAHGIVLKVQVIYLAQLKDEFSSNYAIHFNNCYLKYFLSSSLMFNNILRPTDSNAHHGELPCSHTQLKIQLLNQNNIHVPVHAICLSVLLHT